MQAEQAAEEQAQKATDDLRQQVEGLHARRKEEAEAHLAAIERLRQSEASRVALRVRVRATLTLTLALALTLALTLTLTLARRAAWRPSRPSSRRSARVYLPYISRISPLYVSYISRNISRISAVISPVISPVYLRKQERSRALKLEAELQARYRGDVGEI